MILYLVYQLRRMLQSDAYCYALCLYLYAGMSKITIDITCRMTCSENHRTIISLVTFCHKIAAYHAFHLAFLYYQLSHLGLEMHFPARLDNLLAHVFYHSWQFISADVRMGICKNISRSTELTEHIQYLLYVSTLLTARIELAITVCSCSSFTKTIVGFPIHLLLRLNLSKVFLTLTHIFSSLYDDRTQAMLYQSE